MAPVNDPEADLIATLRHNIVHQATHLDRWYAAQAGLASALHGTMLAPIIIAAARAVSLNQDEADAFAGDFVARQRQQQQRRRAFQTWYSRLEHQRAWSRFRRRQQQVRLRQAIWTWHEQVRRRRLVRAQLHRAVRLIATAVQRRAFGSLRRYALQERASGIGSERRYLLKWRRTVGLARGQYVRRLERVVLYQFEQRHCRLALSSWRSVFRRRRRIQAGLLHLHRVVLHRCRLALRRWLTYSVGCVRRQTESLRCHRQQRCRAAFQHWHRRLVRRRQCSEAVHRSVQIGCVVRMRKAWRRWRLGGLAYRGAEYLAAQLRRRYRQRLALHAWRQLHRDRHHVLQRCIRRAAQGRLRDVLARWRSMELSDRRMESVSAGYDRQRLLRRSMRSMKRWRYMSTVSHRLCQIFIRFTTRHAIRLWRRLQRSPNKIQVVLSRWSSLQPSDALHTSWSCFRRWRQYVQCNLQRKSALHRIFVRIDRRRARLSGVLLLKKWISYIRRLRLRRREVILRWRQLTVVSAFQTWQRWIAARHRARHLIFHRLLQCRSEKLKHAWAQLQSNALVRRATETALNFSSSTRQRERMLQQWVTLREKRAGGIKRIVAALSRARSENVWSAWRQWTAFTAVTKQAESHRIQMGIWKVYSVLLHVDQGAVRDVWGQWRHHVRRAQLCRRVLHRYVGVTLRSKLRHWHRVVTVQNDAICCMLRVGQSVRGRFLHVAMLRWHAATPLPVHVALTFQAQREHYRKHYLLFRWLHITLRRRRQRDLASRTVSRFLRNQLRSAWRQWINVTRTTATVQICTQAVTRRSRYTAMGNAIHWWHKYAAHRARIRYVPERILNNRKRRCLRTWLSLVHVYLYRSEANATYMLHVITDWKRARSGLRYSWARWRRTLQSRRRFRYLAQHAVRTMVYGMVRDCFTLWRMTIRRSSKFHRLRSAWTKNRVQFMFIRWKQYARCRRVQFGDIVRMRRRTWLRRWTRIWRQTRQDRIQNRMEEIEYEALQRRWLLRFWFRWKRAHRVRHQLRRLLKRLMHGQLLKALSSWRQNARCSISIPLPLLERPDLDVSLPMISTRSGIVYSNVPMEKTPTTIVSLFDRLLPRLPRTQAACRLRTLLDTMHRWRSFTVLQKQSRTSIARSQQRRRYRTLRDSVRTWSLAWLKRRLSTQMQELKAKKREDVYDLRLCMRTMSAWRRYVHKVKHEQQYYKRLRDQVLRRVLGAWRHGLRRRQEICGILYRYVIKQDTNRMGKALQRWRLHCISARSQDSALQYRYRSQLLTRTWHGWQRAGQRLRAICRAVRRQRCRTLIIALQQWKRYNQDDRRSKHQTIALKLYSKRIRLNRVRSGWWQWRVAMLYRQQTRGRRELVIAALRIHHNLVTRRWLQRWRQRRHQIATFRHVLRRICHQQLQRHALHTIRIWHEQALRDKAADFTAQQVAGRTARQLKGRVLHAWLGQYTFRVRRRQGFMRVATLWTRCRIRRAWRHWQTYVLDHGHLQNHVTIVRRVCTQIKSRFAFQEWKRYVSTCRRQRYMLRFMVMIACRSKLRAALFQWKRYNVRVYKAEQDRHQRRQLYVSGARALHIAVQLVLASFQRRSLYCTLHHWARYSALDSARQRARQSTLDSITSRSELRQRWMLIMRVLRALRTVTERQRSGRTLRLHLRGHTLTRVVRTWRGSQLQIRMRRDAIRRSLQLGRRYRLHCAIRCWRSFMQWSGSIQRILGRLRHMIKRRCTTTALLTWYRYSHQQEYIQNLLDRIYQRQTWKRMRMAFMRLQWNLVTTRHTALVQLNIDMAHESHEIMDLISTMFYAWRSYQSGRAVQRRHMQEYCLYRTAAIKSRVISIWRLMAGGRQTLRRCSRRRCLTDAYRAWRIAHTVRSRRQECVRQVLALGWRLQQRYALRQWWLRSHWIQCYDRQLTSLIWTRSRYHHLAIYFRLWQTCCHRRYRLHADHGFRRDCTLHLLSRIVSAWRIHASHTRRLKRSVRGQLRTVIHWHLGLAFQRWRALPPSRTPPPVPPIHLVQFWHRSLGELVQRGELLRWACLTLRRRLVASSGEVERLRDQYVVLQAAHKSCHDRDQYREKIKCDLQRMESERNRLLTRLAVYNEEKHHDLNQIQQHHEGVTVQLRSESNSLRAEISSLHITIRDLTHMRDYFMQTAAVLRFDPKAGRRVLLHWLRRLRARAALRACLRRQEVRATYRGLLQWRYGTRDTSCCLQQIQDQYDGLVLYSDKENLTGLELNADHLRRELNERSRNLIWHHTTSSSSSSPSTTSSWPKYSDMMAPTGVGTTHDL